MSAIDNFESYRHSALATAEMHTFDAATLALPALSSPFTSDEGAKRWNAILSQKSIEAPQHVLEKG
jgi:hypothetical protein